MKLTWLGQAGLLLETANATVMMDPYLTDSIADRLGEDYSRLVPLREEYLSQKPDVILLSHDHTDHLDVRSLQLLLSQDRKVLVLAGANAWKKARDSVGGPHNYVQMQPGTEWTAGDVHIRAVQAVHSDPTAVGFVITAEGKCLYATGDTLYSRSVIDQIQTPVDVLITVVNGQGNNMNGTDAARLARKINPKVSIPVHWGLFKKYADTPDEFVKACRAYGVAERVLSIYERIDVDELLKGASL